MNETDIAKRRFIADANGIKVRRVAPIPDWDTVLKEADKERLEKRKAKTDGDV